TEFYRLEDEDAGSRAGRPIARYRSRLPGPGPPPEAAALTWSSGSWGALPGLHVEKERFDPAVPRVFAQGPLSGPAAHRCARRLVGEHARRFLDDAFGR